MSIQIGSAKMPECTKYKVAALTVDPKLGEVERNVSEQLALVEEAAKNGARLIATPEMSTTGYCWYNREEVAPYVEPIPGKTTDRFQAIAAKYDCYIVVEHRARKRSPEKVFFFSARAIITSAALGVRTLLRAAYQSTCRPKSSRAHLSCTLLPGSRICGSAFTMSQASIQITGLLHPLSN